VSAARFEGRGVAVTGAAQGIGRAIALAFVAEGARVAAIDRNAEGLASLLAEGGERVETITADLGLSGAAAGAVTESIRRLGRLHVLVNNAAVMPDGPIMDADEGAWDMAFAVNARAVFFASQAAAGHFAEHGGGVLVNIASANAIRSESPEAVYNASKAAVVSLTQSFAHELGHLGIRAVGVAPGETLTAEELAGMSADDRALEREYVGRIPLRRLGRPPDQAAAVLFLASDEASFISGQTLVVDGGEMSGDWFDRGSAPPIPDDLL
jgi:NAD(P)-dependent dehydrogenase (short-subunit alcohol dehydrogenase family)